MAFDDSATVISFLGDLTRIIDQDSRLLEQIKNALSGFKELATGAIDGALNHSKSLDERIESLGAAIAILSGPQRRYSKPTVGSTHQLFGHLISSLADVFKLGVFKHAPNSKNTEAVNLVGQLVGIRGIFDNLIQNLNQELNRILTHWQSAKTYKTPENISDADFRNSKNRIKTVCDETQKLLVEYAEKLQQLKKLMEEERARLMS
ncbi:hypothetical protein HYU13_06800 [Candidatus Woesearchaeota archaeon]|nr:hypothetical protein [Candidatus Woesearchaeota archaeon]